MTATATVAQKTRSVFRSGVVAVPVERGVERVSYLTVDAYKPAGRAGRTESVFASPTLEGVTRWVRGNHLVGSKDCAVREIKVNPDEVYVYNVRQWEQTSSRLERGANAQEASEAYWDTGMTLREWFERGVDDGDEWELLLDGQSIKNVRNVSPKRVVGTMEDGYKKRSVLSILKGERH